MHGWSQYAQNVQAGLAQKHSEFQSKRTDRGNIMYNLFTKRIFGVYIFSVRHLFYPHMCLREPRQLFFYPHAQQF